MFQQAIADLLTTLAEAWVAFLQWLFGPWLT